ncbi:MAG: HsdM family class I SAM-dependent methyltransferase [Phycisphaerales bacterium]
MTKRSRKTSLAVESNSLAQRAKSAIECMGSALIGAGDIDLSAIDLDRLGFELRVVLQRVLILDRVGMLDEVIGGTADFGWSAVLDLDLESELFHVEQDRPDCAHKGGDRVWSSDWVGLVRREFLSRGGKWFGEVVELVRGDSVDFGALDESLMSWVARVVDDRFELVHQEGSARKLGGVFYTPASVVDFVLDRTLSPAVEACGEDVERLLELRVCDPTCGCGYFLIAAARRIQDRLVELGSADRFGEVIARCVWGGDINPLTAELCRWSLWLEARDRGVSMEMLRSNVVAGDSLAGDVFEAGSFDVVVGNPPFLNQLGSGTARSMERVKSLRERGLLGKATYTDEASVFFVLGLQLARDGGRVCMVQPQSVMATRGGAWMRERVAAAGTLESVWVSNAHVFGDASVYTCGPCVLVGGSGVGTLSIGRWSGAGFDEHPAMVVSREVFGSLETWSSIGAVTMGVPEVEIYALGVVGDMAHATADFRDEYYGLAGKLVEDAECAAEDGSVKVVTTGLIDLGVCHWGRKATRILKQRWDGPRVSGEAFEGDARLAKWVESRRVEKVLVATQTKVVEAFVDVGEGLVAVTPMITVVAQGGADVWRIGAAIGSPVCTMFAMREFGGAAMHADALKMSARQVMGLPLPSDEGAWDEGAAAFERVHAAGRVLASKTDAWDAYEQAVMHFGGVMCAAYGVGGDDLDELMGWWLGRLGISAHLKDLSSIAE